MVVTRAAAEEDEAEAGAGVAWMEEVGDKHKHKCKHKYVDNSEKRSMFSNDVQTLRQT